MTKILDRKQVNTMIGTLVNPVDQFILIAVYYGMKKEEIATLEVENVSLEDRIIRVGDKKIKIDEAAAKILKDTLEENTYYKNTDYAQTNSSYTLNMSSKYVVKAKPTKANGNGLDCMKVAGTKKRIESLLHLIDGEVTSKDFALSGAINQLLEKASVWKIQDIEKELKELGYNLKAYNVYKVLQDLGHTN